MDILKAENFYHIYNHANGFENLFQNDENYRWFMQQWQKHINPIAETYCYCLMPNHIHFLIKMRSEAEVSRNLFAEGGIKIQTLREFESKETLGKFGTFPKFDEGLPFGKFQTFRKVGSKRFANLFSSYTQAYNKMYKRRGSLFIPNFKRKEIINEKYLTTLICYIHRNPVHHGFCKHFEDWKHSSYTLLLSDEPTFLNRNLIADYFENKDNFIASHNQYLNELEDYYLE